MGYHDYSFTSMMDSPTVGTFMSVIQTISFSRQKYEINSGKLVIGGAGKIYLKVIRRVPTCPFQVSRFIFIMISAISGVRLALSLDSLPVRLFLSRASVIFLLSWINFFIEVLVSVLNAKIFLEKFNGTEFRGGFHHPNHHEV